MKISNTAKLKAQTRAKAIKLTQYNNNQHKNRRWNYYLGFLVEEVLSEEFGFIVLNSNKYGPDLVDTEGISYSVKSCGIGYSEWDIAITEEYNKSDYFIFCKIDHPDSVEFVGMTPCNDVIYVSANPSVFGKHCGRGKKHYNKYCYKEGKLKRIFL